MLLKRYISIIIALMLVITVPIAVFAENPDPDDSVKSKLENHAQNAEGAAKDAKDNLGDIKSSVGNAQDAMDKLDQAVKDVDKALDGIDKNVTENAANDAVGAVDNATGAVDNMPEHPDGNDVDGVGGLVGDAQDAVEKAADAVNDDALAINGAVADAKDAVEKAREITQAANDAIALADGALVSANDALEQAQLADEAYRELLQEVIDGSATPSTYEALADAENAREAAWNNYMGAVDDAFNALGGAIKEVQDAQKAANDAYDLWVTAEASMQSQADRVEFGDLSNLRTRAFVAAAASCNSALDAAITALELRGMAEAAQRKTTDAANKANGAVQWQDGLRKLVDTAIADLEKAIDDANKIIGARNKEIKAENDLIEKENEKKQKEFEKTLVSEIRLLDDEKGNSVKIHDLDVPSDSKVYLYIYDSNNRITKTELTLSGNGWNSEKVLDAISKDDTCRTIIISINGIYYSVPQFDSGNWGGNGTVNFNGAELTELIADGLDKPIKKLKHLPSIKELDGPRSAEGLGTPEFETLEKLRGILNEGQFGGSDITVREETRYRGGGGGGGGGGTVIFDVAVPLTEIGDVPVPLAGVDTVTIVDDGVPLAKLPRSGGLLGLIASNIVTVDMCLPYVHRKRGRYTIKNIRKK